MTTNPTPTPTKRNHASAREDGLFAYLVSTSSWGKTRTSIVWSGTLKAAKATHGWTREQHTSITVARATVDELEASRG